MFKDGLGLPFRFRGFLSDYYFLLRKALIDIQSGYHIWSQNYDRSFDEVFAVQDDIAFNIAQSLMLTLDESDQPVLMILNVFNNVDGILKR